MSDAEKQARINEQKEKEEERLKADITIKKPESKKAGKKRKAVMTIDDLKQVSEES